MKNIRVWFGQKTPDYVKGYVGICLPSEITDPLKETGAILTAINFKPPGCDYILCNVDKAEDLARAIERYPYIKTDIVEMKTRDERQLPLFSGRELSDY